MRILFIAPDICRPDTASGHVRFSRLMALMCGFAHVDLLIPTNKWVHSWESHYWDELESSNIQIIHPAIWNHLETHCQTTRYDWIIAEFWHQAETLIPQIRKIQKFQPTLKFATDSVDIHFLRELAGLRLKASASEQEIALVHDRKSRELAVYHESDLVFVVSEEDQQSLRDNHCRSETEIIPNIVSLYERAGTPDANTLLFIGGFRHAPNVDAVLWFVDQVFPLIRSEIPNVVFRIVGSHPPKEITELSKLDGINVVGFVKCTASELDNATVSIAPLRYGAGMKGKVTEALSCGMPVVTTSFGAQGLGATNGIHMFIADDPQQFAHYVCLCLKNPTESNRVGIAGKQLISNLCGPEVVKERLKACLSKDISEKVCSLSPVTQAIAKLKILLVCCLCDSRVLLSKLISRLRSLSH